MTDHNLRTALDHCRATLRLLTHADYTPDSPVLHAIHAAAQIAEQALSTDETAAAVAEPQQEEPVNTCAPPPDLSDCDILPTPDPARLLRIIEQCQAALTLVANAPYPLTSGILTQVARARAQALYALDMRGGDSPTPPPDRDTMPRLEVLHLPGDDQFALVVHGYPHGSRYNPTWNQFGRDCGARATLTLDCPIEVG